jgi:glycosyltransferase involved in cell wall biosynthesis
MRSFDVKSLGEIAYQKDGKPAEVAVIVPLYNYEEHIIECLKSVVAQTLPSLAIVVVDDCSTDNGPERAIEFLNEHSSRFQSVRVVHHARNQGLSMARNSGIAWSEEPLLFMLDADNRIRPPALTRLKSAIEVDGADFAYSQLFIFGDEIGIGSADIWHVDRLRHGNTIDAMAMIRRPALLKAEGYDLLADDHGWEDYDLWCRFYAMGIRGVFVPELLCDYRRHLSSMVNSRTNHNLDTVVAEMALRHPNIFVREPRLTAIENDFSIGVPLKYEPESVQIPPRVAAIVHMFAEELTDEIVEAVANVPYQPDLFISTDTAAKKSFIASRLKRWPGQVEIRITPRQGRDIAPRLLAFRDVYDSYEYILLLHSKASSHAPRLRKWRQHLLANLAGSREVVESIFEIFTQVPDVGIVAGQHLEGIREWLGWGENYELANELAGRFGVSLYANGPLDYPSGSMLWARAAALKPLIECLTMDDFTPDTVGRQLDGTMAHAVERLFYVAAEAAGFSWVKVARPEFFSYRDTIEYAASPMELRDMVLKRRRCIGDNAVAYRTLEACSRRS